MTPDPNSQVHACCRYIVTDGSAINAPQPEKKCTVLMKPEIVVKIVHLSTLWFVHKEEKHMTIKTAGDTGELYFQQPAKLIKQQIVG